MGVGELNAAGRHLQWRRAHDARQPGNLKKKKREWLTSLPKKKQYTAAAKSSTLDPTAKAIATLGALLQKDPKLAEILSAPTLVEADKKAIVDELTKQAGVQGPTIKNFLDTLAENNRLGLLGDVCEKFSTIISAARGEVEMKVTSAQVRASPFASFFFLPLSFCAAIGDASCPISGQTRAGEEGVSVESCVHAI